jgi:succinate-semialdehyde dehydrogenase/glutarate-semialdehyde dehydrogenase
MLAAHAWQRLEVGMVELNRGIASEPAAPFGGVKQSGLGREGGRGEVMEHHETQYFSASWQ